MNYLRNNLYIVSFYRKTLHIANGFLHFIWSNKLFSFQSGVLFLFSLTILLSGYRTHLLNRNTVEGYYTQRGGGKYTGHQLWGPLIAAQEINYIIISIDNSLV